MLCCASNLSHIRPLLHFLHPTSLQMRSVLLTSRATVPHLHRGLSRATVTLPFRSPARCRAMASAAGSQPIPTLVSPQWLNERLGQPDIKVLDASWYLPSMGKDRMADFKAARIPGAQYFDIDGVCAVGTSLPHMLPTEAQFAAAMDALGVSNDSTVVVYDGFGMFSAPRAWWTFRVFGHGKVAVLEGGLPAWHEEGLPVDAAPPAEGALDGAAKAAQAAAAGGGATAKYQAKLQADKVRSVEQMLEVVGGHCSTEQVMDARPAGRFKGIDPEPRAGMRGGHMPGARNVPIGQVYKDGQMANARLKSPAELRAVFEEAGVDIDKPLVASCGSGLTACVLALAAHQATGGKLLPVYDGSWSEWGSRQDTPIVKDEQAQQ